jgi:hypothetical protein
LPQPAVTAHQSPLQSVIAGTGHFVWPSSRDRNLSNSVPDALFLI